ncbi:MAG: hypothetical protein JRH06_16020 [Deltaproteobacteria bacterium]|nr:hypothetical protein [Deltaproteobacteria bacterium]MBW2139045.1 hypothetical protein [Deltaproteobacteria bacterium]
MENSSTYGSSQLSLFDRSNKPAEDPEEVERLLENAKAFALEWGEERHGSAQEFVQAMQAEFGPKIRMYLVEIAEGIAKEKGLPQIIRQYFDATLSYEDLTEALGSKPGRKGEEQSSLDELFQRSIRLQASKKYAEAIAFVSKLPKSILIHRLCR